MGVMASRWTHVDGLRRAVGWPAAANILARRLLGLRQPVHCSARGSRIAVRPLDSDLFVASQIFGRRNYDPGDAVTQALNQLARRWSLRGLAPVIIDAGANVGYAALDLAERFPEAVVIAVEPDPETFAELVANCIGEPRIQPVRAAVWSHEDGVSLLGDSGRGSWAHRVAGHGATPSRTLASLLALVSGGRPLIIKLNIEGAEREVCAASGEELRQAACLMIEPHDVLTPGSACLSTLYEALAGLQVDTLLRGENLIIYASALIQLQPMSLAGLTFGGAAGSEGPSSCTHRNLGWRDRRIGK
jgi:FkbM family methyltransferase